MRAGPLPAIVRLHGVATGRIHVFCSEACRAFFIAALSGEAHSMSHATPSKVAWCEWCGVRLVQVTLIDREANDGTT